MTTRSSLRLAHSYRPRILEVGSTTLAVAVLTLILLAAGTASAEEGEKLYYESRDQIATEYRWDLSGIFSSLEEWKTAAAEVEAAAPKLDVYRGRLAESPELLAEALNAQFDIYRQVEDVFVYANELLHTNTADAAANEASGRAQALYGAVQEAAAYIDPEIAQIPDERLAEILRDPVIEPYHHYIDNVVRTKEHILSPEVEKILAASSVSGAAYRQAFSALQDTSIKWPTIEDSAGEEQTVVPGQYLRFVTDENRDIRREASFALFNTYDQYASTFAATLGGSIQRNVWLARTRGYDSSLEMVLDGSNVPRAVVDTLVGSVRDNIGKIQSYAGLRKRLLKLDDLHIYDMYVNLLPGIDKTYTYDEGWSLAMEFWRETFGAEYAEVAEKARNDRWVDVYSNQGKQPGAYSWGTYNSHPYLFLNWNGKLDAVSTLVHEMGHSIHQYLANQNQPYHDADYSLFVAEVASVASESLFMEWMYRRSTDPDERKLLLNQSMNDITGTFVRQIFFHEWEHIAHEMAERGEPLTKETLGKAYGDLWQAYYGEDLVVDDPYKAGWSRISHYYRNYYVWIYATSYAAGEAIAARVRAGDEGAVEDYLAMLKLGGSVYPMEAVARSGVDMNDPEVIRSVMDRYGELQTQLEKELVSEPPSAPGS